MEPAERLAYRIVESLQEAGQVAYWAGGCVRDRLMGRKPSDFDVATAARPEEVLRLFPRSQRVGVAFGVVLVREKEAQVEVATFRTDGGYSDGRHPDQVTFTDARTDAQRRDFTCNGLFFDPVAQQLHDFVGGQEDIRARLLRAIGDPGLRFTEDHLRMLRAVRFAAKLEFQIESETFAAMQASAAKITTISRERIHDELARILEHPSRAEATKLLEDSGLLRHLWPAELFVRPEIAREWRGLAGLPAGADFAVALAAMHKDIEGGTRMEIGGGAVAQLLRRELLLSNTEMADLAWLLDQWRILQEWESLSKARLKRLLADPRWPRLEGLFVGVSLEVGAGGRGKGGRREAFEGRVGELRAEGVAPEPFVTGDILIGLGAQPGPAFKGWLEVLYDRQLDGEIRTHEEALGVARGLVAGERG